MGIILQLKKHVQMRKGVREDSEMHLPRRVIFFLMISHFTKQGFCIRYLSTSIQLTTLQLRIKGKVAFPNRPCLNKLSSVTE